MFHQTKILSIVGGLLLLTILTILIPDWRQFIIRLAFLLGIMVVSSKHLLSGLLLGVVFILYLQHESTPFWQSPTSFSIKEGMTNKQDDHTITNGKGPLDLELLKEQFRPKSSKMFPSNPHGGIPKTNPKPVETFENNYL
jgi:hypothetical protein